MQQIPLSKIPAQTFNVVLGSSDATRQNCTLSLYWRQTRLYLDLSTADGDVCKGAICQNRADILQSRSRHFDGSLHFFDLEGIRPPHWEGLNDRHVLVYVEKGEELPETLRY